MGYRIIRVTPDVKLKVNSVHVVFLVLFLVLSVARLADPNPSFSFFVTTGSPHVNGVVDGQRASTHRFVRKIVASFDRTREFPGFDTFFGVFFSGFTAVFLVLSGFGLEPHGPSAVVKIHQGWVAYLMEA